MTDDIELVPDDELEPETEEDDFANNPIEEGKDD